MKDSSVVYEVAEQLHITLTSEIRVACAGHIQRGGNPCPYDRIMATRFGVEGAKLNYGQRFWKTCCFKRNQVTSIKLEETAGKLKYVDPREKKYILQGY